MPFPPLRRKDRALTQEETLAILAKGLVGYLGLISPTGYPYVVPMNYTYAKGKIYLHCAMEGHKIDCLRGDSRVCFSVTVDWKVIPEHTTTTFESVILFGQARLVEDPAEKEAALRALLIQSGVEAPLESVCNPAATAKTAIICIEPEQITGKRRPIPGPK